MVDLTKIKFPTSGVENLLRIIKANEEFRKAILKTVLPSQIILKSRMNELTNRLIAPMKVWQAQLNIFNEQMRKFSEWAKEAKRIESRIKKSKNKWILYDELPMTILSLYDYKTHKFRNFLDDLKYVDKFVDFHKQNKYINPYSDILKQGTIAHVKKDYITSIPLFLIVVDGAFYTYGLKKRLVKKAKIKGVKPPENQANFKNISKYLEGNYGILSKEFIDFIDNPKIKSRKSKKNQLWTYRNSVFHGTNPYYADEQWSIKLLFVLRILECGLK